MNLAAAGDDPAFRPLIWLITSCDRAAALRRCGRGGHALIGAFETAYNRTQLGSQLLRDLPPAHMLTAHG